MATQPGVVENASTLGSPYTPRPDNLAMIYQEAFTAVMRLRSGRQQASDATTFRAHMKQLLTNAEQEAQNRGYPGEDARLATFAVVAFLDESVLNLQSPLFADWPRKPLQEELFGGHVAGEVFFQSLQRLLGRTDSPELADILEVFLLSLLLGYRGKYGVGGQAEVHGLIQKIRDKIRRIREDPGILVPEWEPPAGRMRALRDPWLRRLTIAAIVCFVIAVVFFAAFKLALASGVSDVREAVVETRG